METIHAFVQEYLTWLAATNHAPATVRNRRVSLQRLLRWIGALSLEHPQSLTRELLEAYRVSLFQARRRDGRPLGWGTQAEHLSAVRGFLGWCAERSRLPTNPAEQLVLPKRPLLLPRGVLDPVKMEAVLRTPDRARPLGLRDRALLELLYSTGLRRAEVSNLEVQDVDLSRRIVFVRAGKGQRDRVVPIGRRAIRWLLRYLRRVRPLLVKPPDTGRLFLSRRGTAMALNRLSERVHRYLAAAGVPGGGSCHLFRHTMATLLLEGGADIRDVQEILGHTNLSTTARYTHIAIGRLQAVHARAHPAERAERARH